MVTSYELFPMVLKIGCLRDVILDEYNFVRLYLEVNSVGMYYAMLINILVCKLSIYNLD